MRLYHPLQVLIYIIHKMAAPSPHFKWFKGMHIILTYVSLGEEVTAGKFYASFLIQDYFKKYRKRKEKEKKKKGKDKSASLQVHS